MCLQDMALMKYKLQLEEVNIMINYIKEMREMIGNKPLLLVGTSVISIKDNKILLQKRSDSGLWGIQEDIWK